MIKRAAFVIAILVFLSAAVRVHSAYVNHMEMDVYGRSVVRLLGDSGGGTGFQVLYKGHQVTMTNDHVCGIARTGGVLLGDSPYAPIHALHILVRSPDTDLCILTPMPELPPLHLGPSEFKTGDALTVLGHPKLRPLEASHGHATHISEIDVLLNLIQTEADKNACTLPKNRIIDVFFGFALGCAAHVRAQETTAHIEPGNSGSPVINRAGQVKGVAFAAGGDGKAAIIPLRNIMQFLRYADKVLSSRVTH